MASTVFGATFNIILSTYSVLIVAIIIVFNCFDKLPPMNIVVDLDKVVFDCDSIPYTLVNIFFTTSKINRKLRYNINIKSEGPPYSFHIVSNRIIKIQHY